MKNDSLDLIGKLNWRYAVKQFQQGQKFTPEIETLFQNVLRLTPSSFGLQPWKFICIANQDLKAKLQSHSWNQAQIGDCSYLVVLAAEKDPNAETVNKWASYLKKTNPENAKSLDKYQKVATSFLEKLSQAERKNWAEKQVYIALGQLLTAAAVVGLDACPMEGIDRNAYNQLLDLDKSPYQVVVVCALGYRDQKASYAPKDKQRFPLKAIIDCF